MQRSKSSTIPIQQQPASARAQSSRRATGNVFNARLSTLLIVLLLTTVLSVTTLVLAFRRRETTTGIIAPSHGESGLGEAEHLKAQRQRDRIKEFLGGRAIHLQPAGVPKTAEALQDTSAEAELPLLLISSDVRVVITASPDRSDELVEVQVPASPSALLEGIHFYAKDQTIADARRRPILDDSELRAEAEAELKVAERLQRAQVDSMGQKDLKEVVNSDEDSFDDFATKAQPPPPPTKNRNEIRNGKLSPQGTNITPSAAFIRYIRSHAVHVRLMPTAIPPKVVDEAAERYKNIMYVGGVMGGGPPTNAPHDDNDHQEPNSPNHYEFNQRRMLQFDEYEDDEAKGGKDRNGLDGAIEDGRRDVNPRRGAGRRRLGADDPAAMLGDRFRTRPEWVLKAESVLAAERVVVLADDGHRVEHATIVTSKIDARVALNRLYTADTLTLTGGSSQPPSDGILYTPSEEVRPLVLLVPVNEGYIDFGLNLLCSLKHVDDEFIDHFGPTIESEHSLADALRSAEPGILSQPTLGPKHFIDEHDHDEAHAESGGLLSHGDARLLEHLLSSLNLKTKEALFPATVDEADRKKTMHKVINDLSFTGMLQYDPESDSAISGKGFVPGNKHADDAGVLKFAQAAGANSATSEVGRGLLFTSMDSSAYKILKDLNLPVFHDPQMPFITKEAAAWGHESFHQLVCSKLIPVIRILKSGVDVVFSDADIAFAKPFLPMLRPLSEVSVQFSIGSCHKAIADNTDLLEDTLKKFNTGFYYVKSTPQMIHLLERGHTYCSSNFLTGDQPALNSIIKDDTTQRNLGRASLEEKLRVQAERKEAKNKGLKISVDNDPDQLLLSLKRRERLNDALVEVAQSRIIFNNSMYRYGFLDGCLFANGCTYFKGLCQKDHYDDKYTKETVTDNEPLWKILSESEPETILSGASTRKSLLPHISTHALLESSCGTPLHLREAMPRSEPVMVHANYLVGKKEKVQHLRKSGLWFDHCIAEYKRKLSAH